MIKSEAMFKWAQAIAVGGLIVYSTYTNAKQVPNLKADVAEIKTHEAVLESRLLGIEKSLERIENYMINRRAR